MRNSDGRATLSCGVKRSLYDLLGLRVEGAGSLVEEKNLGIAEERASDGDLRNRVSG